METPLRPPGLSVEISFMRSSLSMSPALLRAFAASVRFVVGLENMAADVIACVCPKEWKLCVLVVVARRQEGCPGEV